MLPHTSQMLYSYKMLYNWHSVIDAKYSSKSGMMGSRKYFNGYCPLVFEIIISEIIEKDFRLRKKITG